MSTKKSFSHANPAMSFISAPIVEDTPSQETTPTEKVINELDFNVPMKRNPEFVEVKSKRMQLLMQPSVHNAIKKMADLEDMSVNEKIHRILKDYIEKN